MLARRGVHRSGRGVGATARLRPGRSGTPRCRRTPAPHRRAARLDHGKRLVLRAGDSCRSRRLRAALAHRAACVARGRAPARAGSGRGLCTGSGAIAVVLQTQRPGARVVATDIDPRAVACAAGNGVDALLGDLFAPLPDDLIGSVDVVVGVVPYVPTSELPLLQRDTFTFERPLSYDGGADGADILRRVLADAPRFLKRGGAMLLEVGGDQAELLEADLERLGYVDVSVLVDEDGDVRGIEATLGLASPRRAPRDATIGRAHAYVPVCHRQPRSDRGDRGLHAHGGRLGPAQRFHRSDAAARAAVDGDEQRGSRAERARPAEERPSDVVLPGAVVVTGMVERPGHRLHPAPRSRDRRSVEPGDDGSADARNRRAARLGSDGGAQRPDAHVRHHRAVDLVGQPDSQPQPRPRPIEALSADLVTADCA